MDLSLENSFATHLRFSIDKLDSLAVGEHRKLHLNVVVALLIRRRQRRNRDCGAEQPVEELGLAMWKLIV